MIEPTWQDVPALVVAGLRKFASEGYLAPVGKAFSTLQAPLGGPHPVATGIVGGLIGAGVGRVAGTAASMVAPRRYRKQLRDLGTVAGAGVGAVPGAVWAAAGNGPLSAWPYFDKTSAYESTGGLAVTSIPVDAFNRAIWLDVNTPQNPFGTKSKWGDNSQPLGTPAPIAAAVSGLIAGTGELAGSEHVSPIQVAMAAATAGGKGYMAGLAAGKILGALAGLPENEQTWLRNTGLWAGAISEVARHVFG